jgi:hypothetical protein
MLLYLFLLLLLLLLMMMMILSSRLVLLPRCRLQWLVLVMLRCSVQTSCG